MFNSPLLEIAIGLVFLFLLYSLLVSAVSEAIASFFGLRARMLKAAIIKGMLSNTSNDSRWLSFVKGIRDFFQGIVHWDSSDKSNNKLGHKFFDHPLIKNYGSSRLFPTPSYINSSNFASVISDILIQDFESKSDEIAKYKYVSVSKENSIEEIKTRLTYSSDSIKIKELLEFYSNAYKNEDTQNSIPIDKETLQIMLMYLNKSGFDFDHFIDKLESWYDDTMNRVSGWYKRQSQVIILILGFLVAVIFNVDTIEIAGKLSTDKQARENLVLMATQSIEKFKDDPRVKKIVTSSGTEIPDTSKTGMQHNDSLYSQYLQNVENVKTLLNDDINNTSTLLAIGWGNFGSKPGISKTKTEKIGYVLKKTFTSPRKILGFLILAFAVSLGAPFWFDLLNKLVKLRGVGKKEETETTKNSPATASNTPVTVNLNNQNSGVEAVG